jgi:hypothetical protein
MSALLHHNPPDHKMTVDEYLVWAEGRPGLEIDLDPLHALAPERRNA